MRRKEPTRVSRYRKLRKLSGKWEIRLVVEGMPTRYGLREEAPLRQVKPGGVMKKYGGSGSEELA